MTTILFLSIIIYNSTYTCLLSYRDGWNIPIILDSIGIYENDPDATECGGVDYKSIYKYIASLSRGHVPKQLDAPSAAKLAQLYDQMMDFVNERLPVAKKILEMSVQQPLKKAALSAAEKNKMLNERRCKTWLPAEEEARNKVTSSDISLLKQYYCSMEGLNPFQLPPSTMTLPDSV